MKYCTKCGTRINEGQKFCISCGAPTENSDNTVGSMGMTNNEQTIGTLFDKMETNTVMTGSQENIERIKQEQLILHQEQERKFAKIYIEKQNSLSDNSIFDIIDNHLHKKNSRPFPKMSGFN